MARKRIDYLEILSVYGTPNYVQEFNDLNDRVQRQLLTGWREGERWTPKEVRFLPEDSQRLIFDLLQIYRSLNLVIRERKRKDGWIYIFEGKRE